MNKKKLYLELNDNENTNPSRGKSLSQEGSFDPPTKSDGYLLPFNDIVCWPEEPALFTNGHTLSLALKRGLHLFLEGGGHFRELVKYLETGSCVANPWNTESSSILQ